MVLDEPRAEDLVLPVARLYVPDLTGQLGDGVGEELVVRGVPVDLIGGILAEVHHVVSAVHLLETEVGVVLDLAAVAATALGGDQDDAVRAAVSVDGRRGGILEDLDRGDIVGVDHREGGHTGVVAVDTAACGGADVEERESVEDDQRGGRTGERVGSSDEHVGLRAGFTRRGVDHQTGHAACQGVIDREEDAVFEGIALDRGDGSGHVLFAERAVTDHDDVVDFQIGGSERDVDARTLSDGFADGVVPEEAEYEDIIRRADLDTVCAAGIGRCADGRAVDDHRSAGDGFAVRGGDRAADGGLGPEPRHDEQQGGQYGNETFHGSRFMLVYSSMRLICTSSRYQFTSAPFVERNANWG